MTAQPATSARRRVLALSTAIIAMVALSSCTETGALPTPTAEPTPAATAAATETAAPAATPTADPDASGLAFDEVDVAELIAVLEGYGWEFEDEPREGIGESIWIAYTDDGEVQIALHEADDALRRIGLYDYSAGELGLDDMGFLLGLFAPEAESWLVESAEMALEDPGTPVEGEFSGETVNLIFEAFTDDHQSLDLVLEPR